MYLTDLASSRIGPVKRAHPQSFTVLGVPFFLVLAPSIEPGRICAPGGKAKRVNTLEKDVHCCSLSFPLPVVSAGTKSNPGWDGNPMSIARRSFVYHTHVGEKWANHMLFRCFAPVDCGHVSAIDFPPPTHDALSGARTQSWVNVWDYLTHLCLSHK